MWCLRGIVVLVVCMAGAFEDVFDEIPSQFEGWQLFMGLSADAQAGKVAYRDYSLQGVFAPKARIEASFQSEKGMWVKGVVAGVSVGVTEPVLFEKAAEILTVKQPFACDISLRRGFLFNPSTMLGMYGGVGLSREVYTQSSKDVEESVLYLKGGLSIVLSVLTTWGVEVGVDAMLRQEKDTTLNDRLIENAPRAISAKMGMVYQQEVEY